MITPKERLPEKQKTVFSSPSFISPLSFFLSRAGLAVWHLARLYQKRLECVIPLLGKAVTFGFFPHLWNFFFSRELICAFCLICFHRKLVPTASRRCDIPWWLSDPTFLLGPSCAQGILAGGAADPGVIRPIFSVTSTLASHAHLPALP